MDPVTALGTVAAVVQLAGTAAKTARDLYEFCSIIHNAPQEIMAITRDAHTFYVLVGNLERSLRIEPIAAAVRQDADIIGGLVTLKDPIDNCCKAFIKVSEQLQSHTTPNGSHWDRFNWFLKRREVAGLATELERTKTTFGSAMATVTLLIMLKTSAPVESNSPDPIDHTYDLNDDVGSALTEYAESVTEIQIEQVSLTEPETDRDSIILPVPQLPSQSAEAQSIATKAMNGGLLTTDKDGWSPLHSAARNGHLEVVKILLKAGSDANALTNRKWTPLMSPCNTGHIEVVKALLDAGVDYNLPDAKKWTALHFAANHGHEAIVKLLLAKEEIHLDCVNDVGHTPLWTAAERGRATVVKLLLDTGKVKINHNTKDETPFYCASRNGHEAVVKLFLATGKVNVDHRSVSNESSLWWAARRGYVAVFKLIFDTGEADFDMVGRGDVEGMTPLYWAARNGHETICKILLDTDSVNVNAKTKLGGTPLIWAARGGYETIVKLLLETGKVNLDMKDHVGATPLYWAARNGHVVICKILLHTGAVNVNARTELGGTPLLWAARNGYEAIVKLLLETEKVNVEMKDHVGRTALWYASENGHMEIVKLLCTS